MSVTLHERPSRPEGSEVRKRKRQEVLADFADVEVADLPPERTSDLSASSPYGSSGKVVFTSERSAMSMDSPSGSNGLVVQRMQSFSQRPLSKLSIQHQMSAQIPSRVSVNSADDDKTPTTLDSRPKRSASFDMGQFNMQGTDSTLDSSQNFKASMLTHAARVTTFARASFRRILLWRCLRCLMACMETLVKSKIFITTLTLVSIFALFGDDIRLAFTAKEDDKIFNWITIVSLCLFTFEITISCIALQDYACSFFFFLDVVSTISLVLDLTFVWEAVAGYQGFSVEDHQTSSEQGGAALTGQSEYARAGRSSRVGTRMVRMLRVVRLVRVARVFKFFLFADHDQKEAQIKRASRLLPGAEIDDYATVAKESMVGQKLSERTTLWVIVLVLAMLIMVPLLHVGDSSLMVMSSAEYGADILTQAWEDFIKAELSGVSPSVLIERRRYWEEQLLTYIFYHNHEYAECPRKTVDGAECASDDLFKLCFWGFVAQRPSNETSILATREHRLSNFSWDALWSSLGPESLLQYIPGRFPEDIKDRILQPWSSTCSGSSVDMYGVSLLRDEPCPWTTRRPQEITWFLAIRTPRDFYMQGQMVFFFDIAESIRMQAVMAIIQTTFIIGALLIGSILFSKDTDTLVLQPIETMITKIARIRKDPLYATTMGDEIYRIQHARGAVKVPLMQRIRTNRIVQFCKRVKRKTHERLSGKRSSVTVTRRNSGGSITADFKPRKKLPMETKILENTIIKLGSLLALGFGEAGTEIVGENLDDDGTNVNVLIPGRSVEAIYGFCQINNFTITTEVLGEKTVMLVNKVALIVHTIIDQCLGSANKNMGEAFLLVWRIDRYSERLRPKIADLSVLSFIQVVVEVNRDAELAAYREHPGLLARHESYRVSLTFGLHVGYSIEGAIGSEFKIDASYLSSHVTLATCLGSLALCYDVQILMSEPLVCCCSEIFQFHFRAIDRILMEGAKSPLRIFTIDLDSDAVFVNHSRLAPRREPNRYLARVLRAETRASKLDESYEPIVTFNTDRHIQRMRAVYFLEFFQDFEKGFLNYEAGEWDVACQVLLRTCQLLRKRAWHYNKNDGPSCALLDYMHGFKYQAPVGWFGYRKVSEINRLNTKLRCVVEI